MPSKLDRHNLILELITLSPVKTQDELKRKLLKRGIRVNQATLSRDIKELGLFKTSIHGEQRYAAQETIQTTTKQLDAISKFVRSIDCSNNIIVIKTDTGAANHVAEYLDGSALKEILGTVAGDNTIFLVINEKAKSSKIITQLRNLFTV